MKTKLTKIESNLLTWIQGGKIGTRPFATVKTWRALISKGYEIG
jgi:hypothetical protein